MTDKIYTGKTERSEKAAGRDDNGIISYQELVTKIGNIHTVTSSAAKGAVNQLLTIRNWVIGYYIVEFEQSGKDRAEYGKQLLKLLEESIDVKGMNTRLFYKCRVFYTKYPQIFPTVSEKLKKIDNSEKQKLLPDTFDITPQQIFPTASEKFTTAPEILISKLSFSHIIEIAPIDDPLERFFYEFECIRGVWSVQELRRQIASNLYFRAGVSRKPELLLEQIQKGDFTAQLTVREPFALEFLGLDDRMAVSESDLEDALILHLQQFLLESGKGFCFEARQKRLLIDDEYFYPDLVFYHRYLHCNVIIDLKDHEFRHEDLGQLNAYVGYYKKNEMSEGDNPPIGILLCTQKGPQMVEYALSGMDNQLFVSTYMLQLPNKEQLRAFLIEQIDELSK